ncbi:hypothetical protein CHELA20_52133 [Hyphomicrobiales bacterium]|nr:hypothetical protein CHELA41_22787 [Hyphomicrobiales bacterium]CAH1680791.1 hypothetical protein CHELA20_52133 [Hyphomicrobiales bacterium]
MRCICSVQGTCGSASARTAYPARIKTASGKGGALKMREVMGVFAVVSQRLLLISMSDVLRGRDERSSHFRATIILATELVFAVSENDISICASGAKSIVRGLIYKVYCKLH